MNVIFLDFDGVVNTPWWSRDENGGYICKYNFPCDGKVNNCQAVQWVSEFCEKFNYSIVISSTWRMDGLKKCSEYLLKAGLRKSIEILGITPDLISKPRGCEISLWLKNHQEVEKFLIFDDDDDMMNLADKLVKCDTVVGFTQREFNEARTLHEAFNK